jgi:uncharacterized protein (DUF302 family)
LIFVLGLVVGLIGAGVLLMVFGPGLMIEEEVSPVGVEDTVARLDAAAKAKGWSVIGVQKVDQSVKKHGAGDILPVSVMSVCHPKHAAKILGEDGNRYISVMMPCRIAVYAKKDGKAYVSTLNAGLVGGLFGGTISEVMTGPVAEAQAEIVDAALKP